MSLEEGTVGHVLTLKTMSQGVVASLNRSVNCYLGYGLRRWTDVGKVFKTFNMLNAIN